MSSETKMLEDQEMSNSSQIGKNLLWMIWSGSISIANSVLLWVFFARMREVDELGRFTIVMGFYGLFYGACSLGLIPFIVNEISRKLNSIQNSVNKDIHEKEISNFIATSSLFLFGSGIVCAILMSIFGFISSDLPEVRLSVFILSVAMIPTGLINSGEAAAIAFGKNRMIAVASTVENILRTIIPFVLIYLGCEIWVICLSFTAVRFFGAAIYAFSAKVNFSSIKIIPKEIRNLAKAVPLFGGTVILSSINWQIAIIFLSNFSTEVETAKYGVASRFLIPVSILMASFSAVIQPVISRYLESASKTAYANILRFSSLPIILSIVAAILSPFLSRFVVSFTFGEKYADVSPILDVLAMSVVPFCIVIIVSRGLIAMNSQRIDLIANLIGVITAVLLCTILIPKYGAFGAAIAQLSSFSMMAFYELNYVTKRFNSFRLWANI